MQAVLALKQGKPLPPVILDPGFVIHLDNCFTAEMCWDVLQNERCVALMRAFIAAHPTLWNEDIGE